MTTLIIYAHSNKDSLNHAILENVMKGLKEAKRKFELIDLYAEKFNPVLVIDNQQKLRDLMHDPYTEKYRKKIEQADQLIFIYPIWWYGVPAILKGFFDRVFVSGFAYQHKGIFPKGLLKNKSAWVIYTIDAPSLFIRLFRKNVEWIVVRDYILKFCGIKNIKRTRLTSVKHSTYKTRQKWLQKIYQLAKVI
ncbi:NAD(P)H-dependent oxidoreductase [Neobacillus vireti]|uniref:NAD(P)H dehydrogenase (Quinone) n=1 Tax=Neobacillus vireti LMG 21834 TaxID=1131730 RepID=A0AB94ITM5_9BACI|nr:NAD(P)H-dependent oxidoreductase [Neobacillus vireti]ETI70424.1 NAD(P)H dehydrogenase (quinone) [Neobacillus vireti LMG 21834]KLT17815.1 NADPH dehydrogenase [Neobacillus vireti]